MGAKTPIRLKVSKRSDFFPPVCALYLLALVAALIGPSPVMSIAVAGSVFLVAWIAFILDFSKSNNNVELTSVIFPDGEIQLESGKRRLFVGVLNGRQWCTRHLAVLRIMALDGSRSLVILPGRQRDADEFRRLSVWLRQERCNDAVAGLR